MSLRRSPAKGLAESRRVWPRELGDAVGAGGLMKLGDGPLEAAPSGIKRSGAAGRVDDALTQFFFVRSLLYIFLSELYCTLPGYPGGNVIYVECAAKTCDQLLRMLYFTILYSESRN